VQKLKTLAKITAGDLPGAGLDVDVAADPVQVKRERVDEGLPG
jgi:hypothetical protein